MADTTIEAGANEPQAPPTSDIAGAKTTRPARKPPRRSAARRLQRSRRTATKPRIIERRYRQTVKHIDLWSVLKISICFYLTALLVALGAGMVMWWLGTQLGVIEGVEEFMGELLSSEDFQFLSWKILRGATLIGLVIACLMVVLTVLGAAFYNVFSEIVGGVEITVSEDEQAKR